MLNQPVFSGVCCLNQGLHRDTLYVPVRVCVFTIDFRSYVCACSEGERAYLHVCLLRLCYAVCVLTGASTGQLREHSC